MMLKDDDVFSQNFVVKTHYIDKSLSKIVFVDLFSAEAFAESQIKTQGIIAVEVFEIRLKWRQVTHAV